MGTCFPNEKEKPVLGSGVVNKGGNEKEQTVEGENEIKIDALTGLTTTQGIFFLSFGRVKARMSCL